jgi:hypothetical protein
MISTPCVVYLTVGAMHVMQQLYSNKALYTSAPPQTDFLVQALVMACIVELLSQNHMTFISWTLTAPAFLISLMILFYFVLYKCSM